MTARFELEDFRPPTKVVLAALWTSLMFLYVYGDYSKWTALRWPRRAVASPRA
jgi:hypothetical protein